MLDDESCLQCDDLEIMCDPWSGPQDGSVFHISMGTHEAIHINHGIIIAVVSHMLWMSALLIICKRVVVWQQFGRVVLNECKGRKEIPSNSSDGHVEGLFLCFCSCEAKQCLELRR